MVTVKKAAAKKNPGLRARKGTVAAAIAAQVESDPGAQDRRRVRGADDVAISVRLPKAVHDELRRLQYEQRRSIHGMILEGIGLHLKREGVSGEVLELLN